jgi:hypothetical protein
MTKKTRYFLRRNQAVPKTNPAPKAIPARFPELVALQGAHRPGTQPCSSRGKICPGAGFSRANAEAQNKNVASANFIRCHDTPLRGN